jgi:hypothetical protein
MKIHLPALLLSLITVNQLTAQLDLYLYVAVGADAILIYPEVLLLRMAAAL